MKGESMTGRRHGAGHRRRLRSWIWTLGLVGVTLLGCKSGGSKPAPIDPLLGPPRGGPLGRGGNAQAPLPEMPAPTSATSVAALAPGTMPQLDTGSDLRIASNNALVSNNRNAPGWHEPTSGVSLSRPEPLREGGAAASAGITPGITLTGGAMPRLQTLEQGLAWLEARGVRGARLEYVRASGEWRFTCSLPNKTNPELRRTHETQARDPLTAVQAVIERIESEQ